MAGVHDFSVPAAGMAARTSKGDFTKGAGLGIADAGLIHTFECYILSPSRIPGAGSPIVDFESLHDAEELGSQQRTQGTARRGQIASKMKLPFEQAGYIDGRIVIDPTIVRGLEYYTGPVYEVELTLRTETRKAVRCGSGRSAAADATMVWWRGFAARRCRRPAFPSGCRGCWLRCQHLGKIDTKPEFGPVVVTVFDRDRIADYQPWWQGLRDAGIRAELYLGNPKSMGNQFKYADKRHAPVSSSKAAMKRTIPQGRRSR